MSTSSSPLPGTHSDEGRSRSNSPMPDRSPSPDTHRKSDGLNQEENLPDEIELQGPDVAWVLGTQGRVKSKIASVSGAHLRLTDTGSRDMDVDRGKECSAKLEIQGTDREKKLAKKYIDILIEQRKGPAIISIENHDDGDLTLLEIPADCVGYVTGRKRSCLLSIEEATNTILNFSGSVDKSGNRMDSVNKKMENTETLAIFGGCRGRRGAELNVMSLVEGKSSGYFTKGVGESIDYSDEWGTDTVPLDPRELSYALGKGGATRKKIARSSGAIVQYVGEVAFIAGTGEERSRARDYLKYGCELTEWKWRKARFLLHMWKLDNVLVPLLSPGFCSCSECVKVRTQGRSDVSTISLPEISVAYVTGRNGKSLRQIEDQTNTFCFTAAEEEGSDGEGTREDRQRLLIFGADPRGRKRALQMVEDMVNFKMDKQRYGSSSLERDGRGFRSYERDSRGGSSYYGDYGRSYSRGYYQDRGRRRDYSDGRYDRDRSDVRDYREYPRRRRYSPYSRSRSRSRSPRRYGGYGYGRASRSPPPFKRSASPERFRMN